MFPFGRIIEYVSTFCTLEPGDRMAVEVTGLGILKNGIADE